MWVRLGLVLATLAVASGCKDREPAAGSGSGDPRVSPTPAAPAPGDRLGGGPALPAEPDAGLEPAAAPPEQRFADESRDDRWAGGAERELVRRLAQLPSNATLSVTCRSSVCKLHVEVLAGDAASTTLVDAASAIESALRGHASQVVFAGAGSGSSAITAYAVFAR